jgi:hypothetical protein
VNVIVWVAIVVWIVVWAVWPGASVVVRDYRGKRWNREFRAARDEYHSLRAQRELSGGPLPGARERELGAYIDRMDTLAKLSPRADFSRQPRPPRAQR